MISTALMLLANTLLFSLRLERGSSFPRPLSAAEERECLDRLAQGDPEARNTLIEHNLRLVAHIVKKYYAQNADQDDLISIGTIGLIKGISSFDPAKGARLATYAARCIENEILMHFRSQKKLQGEVSLSESIESDRDGNSLQLMDVIGVDDHHAGGSLRPGQRLAPAAAGVSVPHPAGGGSHSSAVRPWRNDSADAAGNRVHLRHQQELRFPNRKAGAGKAPRRIGKAGRRCKIKDVSVAKPETSF